MLWDWRLHPAALARRYGLSYAQADRLIRYHTRLQWRRHGWIGAVALALLAACLVCMLLDASVQARPWLLGGGSFGLGLQLWLAQRAAYPAIMQEAARLGSVASQSAD